MRLFYTLITAFVVSFNTTNAALSYPVDSEPSWMIFKSFIWEAENKYDGFTISVRHAVETIKPPEDQTKSQETQYRYTYKITYSGPDTPVLLSWSVLNRLMGKRNGPYLFPLKNNKSYAIELVSDERPMNACDTLWIIQGGAFSPYEEDRLDHLRLKVVPQFDYYIPMNGVGSCGPLPPSFLKND